MKGVKSVFHSVVFTAVRTLVKYRHTSQICSLLVDLIEEHRISSDGCDFLLALMSATSQTQVGLDYGPSRYGQIRWVCTVRTRAVNRLAWQDFPDGALKALNEAIDQHAQGMSLAEIKQHNQTVLAYQEKERERRRTTASGTKKAAAGLGSGLEFMNERDIHQLTKVR